jgi:lysozyme family protein
MTTNKNNNANAFNIALNKLLKHEGNYANDVDDKGGETYCGISRNNFPNWIGWNIIDHYKNSEHFNEHLKSDFNLQAHVEDFYKINFWNKMNCDIVAELSLRMDAFGRSVVAEPSQSVVTEQSRSVASELFELSVNTGLHRATSILQTALNILNRNEKLYSDILVDGKFGRITLATLRTSLKLNNSKLFFNLLNILQGSFYTELMLNNPVYEKYIGWFNRVVIER